MPNANLPQRVGNQRANKNSIKSEWEKVSAKHAHKQIYFSLAPSGGKDGVLLNSTALAGKFAANIIWHLRVYVIS